MYKSNIVDDLREEVAWFDLLIWVSPITSGADTNSLILINNINNVPIIYFLKFVCHTKLQVIWNQNL